MECIDLREVQRVRTAVSGAWRRWEEDEATAPALQAAVRKAKGTITSAEGSGAWLPQPVRQLRDEVATVEALVTRRQPQAAPPRFFPHRA